MYRFDPDSAKYDDDRPYWLFWNRGQKQPFVGHFSYYEYVNYKQGEMNCIFLANESYVDKDDAQAALALLIRERGIELQSAHAKGDPLVGLDPFDEHVFDLMLQRQTQIQQATGGPEGAVIAFVSVRWLEERGLWRRYTELAGLGTPDAPAGESFVGVTRLQAAVLGFG